MWRQQCSFHLENSHQNAWPQRCISHKGRKMRKVLVVRVKLGLDVSPTLFRKRRRGSNAWQMATTDEKVFFLGKNFSWTLLPGWIWLQMLITWLWSGFDYLQSFRAHFASFKMCWWVTWLSLSRLYVASQPPGSLQRYFFINKQRNTKEKT